MMQKEKKQTLLENWIATHHQGVLAGLILISIALAWQLRFIQDDAFISFTYARSLVEGNGLTWFGNHVEGYTNFLWVLWMAFGFWLGVEPIAWSYVGGMISFAVCIWADWKVSHLIFGTFMPTLLSVVLFAGNFSVLSYGTGGLETMLQTMLLTLSFYQVLRIPADEGASPKRALLLSLTLAAAILTRLDSAVIVLLIVVVGLMHLHRKQAAAISYAALLVPLAVIAAGFFLWRFGYYGRLLPNTFYAKVGWSEDSIGNGLLYLGRFFHWYLIWPFVALGVFTAVKNKKKLHSRFFTPAIVVVAWCLYVVAVGGDFMEFRFAVPMAPFLFITLATLIYYHMPQGLFRNSDIAAIVCTIILWSASAYHAQTFKELTEDKRLDSITILSIFYGAYPDGNWSRFAARMKEDLAGTDAKISTSAVGSIPFYSGLKTVDAIGLCDQNVTDTKAFAPARNFRPGHTRRVTMSYLRQQEVNFALDQPTPVLRGILNRPEATRSLAGWILHAVHRDQPPDSVETVVAMPLDDRTSLLMLYLTRTTTLDSLLRAREWEMREVRLY